jgi:hypothetical protein
MYKSGFGSNTKTGRRIAMGRSYGESWTKTSSSSSQENKGKPPAGVWIMIIIIWLLFIKKLSKIANQQ